MKTRLIIAILLFLPFFTFSQYEKMVETMEDEMEIFENGKLVLRLLNAESGSPVDSATLIIEGSGTYTSDGRGRVLIDPMEDGNYNLSFSRRGYIPANYTLEVVAGTVFSNRFAVSPVLDFGSLRVVVEWGKSPADLDAHLVKEGDYHISYQNMHKAEDGSARLDRDDRKGFGPETITVKNIDDRATYTYFIKNYSDAGSSRSKALSRSKCSVKIYSENKLLKTYTIQPDQPGTTWMVFTIVNGKINDRNEVGNWY